MNKVVYVCTGSCKAEISEEEYKKGFTKCGAKGCTHEGHTFEKRFRCGICGAIYDPLTKHTH